MQINNKNILFQLDVKFIISTRISYYRAINNSGECGLYVRQNGIIIKQKEELSTTNNLY